jgi:hypothetical protein
MSLSSFLCRLGGTIWLGTVAIALIAWIGVLFRIFHYPPWGSIWAFGGLAGLIAFVLAGIAAIWEG